MRGIDVRHLGPQTGGLLVGISVAGVGFMGSETLNRRQTLDTNARLYSELMSRREEAESSLRKDMFVSIIQSFLRPGSASLDERVLNLELLSYNFHESLNLKPLFVYLDRQIKHSGDPNKKEYQSRLYSVASEISRKQMLVQVVEDNMSGAYFLLKRELSPDEHKELE